MISTLFYILIAFLMLSVIVVAHEFGHYIVGRMCGIGVVEFSVGMGPKILSRVSKKGIRYSVRAIPLGGFCKFVGEDAVDDDPRAMNNQPVWKRFLTVLAGPFMNFVFSLIAAVILLLSFFYAENLPVFDSVVEGSPAMQAGILPGDMVTAANGTEVTCDNAGVLTVQEIVLATEPGEKVLLTVERGGETLEIPVTVGEVTEGNVTRPQLGVYFGARRLTFGEAMKYAPQYMVDTLKLMLASLRDLVFKGVGVEDTMGPVGIISFMSETVREGAYMVWNLFFVISLNLGIMNLLPLPALDGGRLVFLLVEGVRRKPIPPEKEGLVHGIGFILLLGLILVITYKDILRLITG